MGEAALRILSASQFTGLYLVAGLAGNAVQMLWHPIQGNTGMPSFALGASGAISGGGFHAGLGPGVEFTDMRLIRISGCIWVHSALVLCYGFPT
jgi:membrane associated rhomboid family serine protease